MRTTLLNLLYSLGVPSLLRQRRVRTREFSVLMFHRVSDEPDLLWPPLPVATFRRLMEELATTARVVPLERVAEEGSYPDRPLVALSFDDGYVDFYDNAVPILAELGLPVHHNICPGLVDSGRIPWTQVVGLYLRRNPGREITLPTGVRYRIGAEPDEAELLRLAARLIAIEDQRRADWVAELAVGVNADAMPRLMGWDEIRRCVAAGVHIGSHGLEHRNLRALRDEGQLAREIAGSKERIVVETGQVPVVFSFPNGLYDAAGLRAVRHAGYEIALLCEDQVSLWSPHVARDGFCVLPRINISRPHWREESLRLLGLHQLLSSKIRRRSHVFAAGSA